MWCETCFALLAQPWAVFVFPYTGLLHVGTAGTGGSGVPCGRAAPVTKPSAQGSFLMYFAPMNNTREKFPGQLEQENEGVIIYVFIEDGWCWQHPGSFLRAAFGMKLPAHHAGI